MAIPATAVLELRATGADTNGGAFVPGSGGQDYTQQDAPQVAVTDAVTNGTTTITSATAGFDGTHVGNVIYLQGGSPTLAAVRLQVLAVVDAQTITVDAAPAAGTGRTLRLGGALGTWNTLVAIIPGGSKAFVKAGAYSITAAPVICAASVATPGVSNPPTRIIGYATTRGDITPANAASANRPVLTYNTAAAGNILYCSGHGWEIGGLVIQNGSGAFNAGIRVGGNDSTIWGCKVVGGKAVYSLSAEGSTNAVIGCEVAGTQSGSLGAIGVGTSGIVRGCWAHDCAAGVGINALGGADVLGNVVSNVPGDGIRFTTNYAKCLGNTVYKAGGHGINLQAARYGGSLITGNVLAECTGYGIASTAAAGLAASPDWDGNAFYGNGGTRLQLDDTTANAVNGYYPYANAFDVSLTADPFVDKTANDFRLNSAPGGGAAARAMAPTLPGFAGLSGGTAAPLDFGALQASKPTIPLPPISCGVPYQFVG